MRQDICTIPISEVFEKKEGCPICTLMKMLNDRIIEYILGAAMMEPDVRIKTNELGFCADHLSEMINQKNKLSLALILETHLDYINNQLFNKKLFKLNNKKTAYLAAKIENTCFACESIDFNAQNILKTLFLTYRQQLEFRELFREQKFLCFPHYRLLTDQAPKFLNKKPLTDFNEDCANLTHSHLMDLKNDIKDFTKMFDYRSSGENISEKAKTSISRTISFLTAKGNDEI